MKIAESWLREWVDPDLGTEALAERLTMAGHEVDGIDYEGQGIDSIVIAEVIEVARHPDADRLSVCQVNDGSRKTLQIVCGAPNVFSGMKTPLAKPGITLPDGVKLRKAKIRGVASNGMLCSAIELGLGDESDGIMELPADAPVGESLVDYLSLPDAVIDLDLTPNRGDCFSVVGIARDVAALTATEMKEPVFETVAATIDDTHPVQLLAPEGCPRFAGRVIRNINLSAGSPVWMTEKLRRAGLRPIHPVVDVTNYVMLELGQPLHAYDLGLVKGPIRPRMAEKGEQLTLLDGKEVKLTADTLVISDDSGAIGIGGIMGGFGTAVTEETRDVFLEAAFFTQEIVGGRARSYGMHTDASLRFERGVDPEGQARAIERATQLLLAISGGDPGPTVVETAEDFVPRRDVIRVRKSHVTRLLGVEIEDEKIVDILERLGLSVAPKKGGWDVVAPSHRFDISLEVDLIEEIARIYGYDEIPETTAISETPLEVVTESLIGTELACATLVARDYQEVVTYSFIDPDANRRLTGVDSELVLGNPISSEMSVMRASLWPGMLLAASANASRQQDRIRLFEVGKSFHGSLDNHEEVVRIAGLCMGPSLPEQWGSKTQSVDFFDIKSDVAALLDLAMDSSTIDYSPVEHPALQPGQAARLTRDGQEIGVIGKLHPRHQKPFDLKREVFMFELDAAGALASQAPKAKSISKFPSIRRDIAVIVDDKISAVDLISTVASTAPDLISDVRIFDIYRGPGIEAGLKSVALGLILQETCRTLTDDDADAAMTAAVKKLEDKFAAQLRE
ncbi:MAG: phenylalanine--tRNA ligase subunit beta [Woeseiaceae bacterium]|nr:phenylalanine--tRNA ligase subunit beta [Woeseiaceae bacterium]NIP20323.1 phenylalanine--tRNA ligase subunit beta [Woeseiaceae bacterium]NIS89213.1 phenylalanine--tRNA ligase subunit beta [Woeseiaceae bacterium]